LTMVVLSDGYSAWNMVVLNDEASPLTMVVLSDESFVVKHDHVQC
jgi:hypothetical protein